MAVFFLFADGVGVGKAGPENPLATEKQEAFSFFTSCNGLHDECPERIEKNILYKPVDANLTIPGLPQSGTGQAALFSGKNAPEIAGRHFGPFPHSKTKFLMEKESLFHKTIEMGKTPFFLNAYPDIFFERSKKRNRWTCTTLMAQSVGMRLNRIKDLKEGNAVTAEITQSAWRDFLGLNVSEITPEAAGKRALNALERYDLVLYEFYLTDKAGHEMNREKADRVLDVLNRFMMEMIGKIKRSDTFVLCSDHGNLENLSIKTHTRNPVPLFVLGNTEPFKKAQSITDITPGILNVLKADF